MTTLFNTQKISNKIVLRNKIAMAPMTTWSSNDDYTISDQEVNYYNARNQGVGLVITGCTHVLENGIGFTNGFGGHDDIYLSSLEKLAKAAKSNGAKAILQLNHAGSKVLPELVKDIVSSSEVTTPVTPFAPSVTPRALLEDEIEEIIKAFAKTALRAIKSGFDGVEIHGAHGFLIQQFLSPHFNKRNDKWGGSLENRMRFALEIVKGIQAVIKDSGKEDFILGYRISPDESIEDGLKVEDTLILTDRLIELGIDYIHTSLGVAYEEKVPNKNRTYVELFAERIAGRTVLIVAGSIQTPTQAQLVLEQGADIVAIGHGLITDPKWVEKAQSDKENEINLTIKRSTVKLLNLPDLLWKQIQLMGSWFIIED